VRPSNRWPTLKPIDGRVRALFLRGFVDVTLGDNELQTLRGLLHDFLPELKFEAARTDGSEVRHVLFKRQALCERLLEQLRGVSTRS